MEIKKKWSKIVLSIYLILLFAIITVWSYKTPLMNDDLFYSHNHILKDSISDYFVLNGRIFGQMFTRFILSRGLLFSSICTGLSFVILVFLLLYITNSIKNDVIYLERILLITVTLFLFVPGFTSVFLWRAGVGNYLMVGVVELFFIFLIYKVKTDTKLISLATFFVGFIAGWGNENTSGGVLLITLLLIVKNYYEKKRFSLKSITGVIGFLLGYIILLLSPGSKKREMASDYAYLQQNFFRRVFKSLERQITFFSTDWWTIVFTAFIITIIVIACIYWRNHTLFIDGIIFIIGGVATALVMIIAPEGMDIGRPYFGSILLLLIGTMLLIPLRIDNKGIKATYISSILIFTLMCFFSVILGYQEAQNFNNQLTARYSYIEHSKNKIVSVRPIKYGKYNKYSLAPVFWEVKPDSSPTTFPNNCYYQYFGKRVKLRTK